MVGLKSCLDHAALLFILSNMNLWIGQNWNFKLELWWTDGWFQPELLWFRLIALITGWNHPVQAAWTGIPRLKYMTEIPNPFKLLLLAIPGHMLEIPWTPLNTLWTQAEHSMDFNLIPCHTPCTPQPFSLPSLLPTLGHPGHRCIWDLWPPMWEEGCDGPSWVSLDSTYVAM